MEQPDIRDSDKRLPGSRIGAGNPISRIAQIAAIQTESFLGLGTVSRLDLEGYTISEIESSAFTGLSNLVDVNLGGNSISEIASAFMSLSGCLIWTYQEIKLRMFQEALSGVSTPSLG